MVFAHDWFDWALLSAVFAGLTAMVATLGLAGIEQLPAVLEQWRLTNPSRVIDGDLQPLSKASTYRDRGVRVQPS